MGVTTFEISIEDFEGLMSDEKTYSFELYVIFLQQVILTVLYPLGREKFLISIK